MQFFPELDAPAGFSPALAPERTLDYFQYLVIIIHRGTAEELKGGFPLISSSLTLQQHKKGEACKALTTVK
jgi:hypothetical protein